MSAMDFGKNRGKTLGISDKLEDCTLNSIRKVLSDAMIERACRSCNYHFRHRVITPVVVVLHLIMSAMWPEDSFNASWQTIWANLVASNYSLAGHCPARGSVSTARNHLPLAVMKEIFNYLSQLAQKLSERYDKWRGHRVVLVDGTCFTTADNAQLEKEFGVPFGFHGKGRYPLVRLVTLCLSNTMTILNYNVGRYATDENALLEPMLKTLRKGDLLLADRHYAGANLYWRYLQNGLEFLTRVNQNLKMSKVKPLLKYSTNDFIGYMKVSAIHRRNNLDLPEKIKVRFIRAEITIRGRRSSFWFVTSLLDADRYPAEEIVGLYADRWRIETLLREVKINAHADILRSQKVEGVYREIAARMSAINVIRNIMLEAAVEHNIEDPLRISFCETVRIILAFAPVMAIRPIQQLPVIYNAMHREIVSHLVPWRPGRNEPRAITHEPKHYPKLKETREQWRNTYAA